ncbi:SEL1-like repeat protein [Vibrio chagasii]|nr:SEL1-like repeat protein [Vibrio chagasii]
MNPSPKDSASQYQLAQAYELGIGVSKNIDDAFYWYSQSAEKRQCRCTVQID